VTDQTHLLHTLRTVAKSTRRIRILINQKILVLGY